MRSVYKDFATFLERRFKFDARYFLSGGFWLSTGQIASIFFGLITTVLFAHFLSETDYGMYRYLVGIAVLLSTFSLTGLGQSVLQTAAKKYYGFYLETLRTNFYYSIGIVAIAVPGAIYYWVNENPTLSIGCLLVALFQPLINTFQFIPSFLQGSKRFKENTILHTLKMVVISVISVIALFITESILILFEVYLISYLVSNILGHFFYRPKAQKTPPEIFVKYLDYAKNTSIRNIVSNVAQRVDTIIVFTQLGATELAIYSIATVIPEQIKGSFKNFASLLIPKFARHDDISYLKKIVLNKSLPIFSIFLLISVFYILLAPFMYSLLFPKYEASIFLSQMIALSFPAMIAVLPFTVLQSHLKDKELHRINTISSITSIMFTLILVHLYGLIGAVVAKILSRYTNLLLINFYLYKK